MFYSYLCFKSTGIFSRFYAAKDVILPWRQYDILLGNAGQKNAPISPKVDSYGGKYQVE
jgi:hypothetical protein